MSTRPLPVLAALCATAMLLAPVVRADDAGSPNVGAWALKLPGGAPGWLGIYEKDGKLSGRMLWGWGSVTPVTAVTREGDTFAITRTQTEQKKDAQGQTVKITITETITAKPDGETLKLTTVKKRPDGTEFGKADFTGQKLPPIGPKPDLAKVTFGEPIKLLNGQDLAGWKLTDPNAVNGWSVKDGVLTNNPVQEQGKPHKNYGNLRTEKEFADFNLTCEINVPKGGNSGIYLRGIYEVQVADTFGKPLNPHNMAGVYSRITPAEAAEKPAGEWQTMDITLVNRHLTVVLNGKKVIDNQPVEGPTGGAMWPEVDRPGPLYLQGDHTGVNYRNIILRPVVK